MLFFVDRNCVRLQYGVKVVVLFGGFFMFLRGRILGWGLFDYFLSRMSRLTFYRPNSRFIITSGSSSAVGERERSVTFVVLPVGAGVFPSKSCFATDSSSKIAATRRRYMALVVWLARVDIS